MASPDDAARDGAYRDPAAGVRARIATKREAVEARLLEAPEERLSALSDALKQGIADARAWDPPAGVTFESLVTVEHALGELLSSLDDALAERAIPEPPAPEPAEALGRDGSAAFLRAEIARLLGASVRARSAGSTEATAKFTRDGVSFGLDVHGFQFVRPGLVDSAPDLLVKGRLSTAAPPGIADLEIRTLTPLEAIGTAIGLLRTLRSGDRKFDAAFRVRGDAGATRLLGNRTFREAFVRLEARSPVLRAVEGRVELRWTNALAHYTDAVVPHSAIDALLAAHLA